MIIKEDDYLSFWLICVFSVFNSLNWGSSNIFWKIYIDLRIKLYLLICII